MEKVSAKRIINQLQNIPSGEAGVFQAFEGNLRITIKFTDRDRLGFLIKKLDVGHSRDGPLALGPGLIEGQVTYLGERLQVIETEANRGISILRSAPPRIEGEVISFFEMVLDRAKGLSLVRYEYDRRRGERTSVPLSFTRDTLERLLVDLIELAREN